MTAGFRPRRPISAVPLWTSAAAVGLSIALGGLIADSPLIAVVVCVALASWVALSQAPRHVLPSAALVAFAVLPFAYLNAPRAFGRFYAPVILIILVWALREILVRRALLPKFWVIVSTSLAIWLMIGAFFIAGDHRLRDASWSIVLLIAIPLAGAAGSVSQPVAARALVNTWAWVGLALGSFGVIEGLTRRNPIAHYYVIGDTSLTQHWSVYRIETTLGHPLLNAMFFAMSGCVLGMSAIRQPRRLTAVAAIVTSAAVVFTASRSGVLGLAAGLGVGVVGVSFSRHASLIKKLGVVLSVAVALGGLRAAPILKERNASVEAQSSAAYRHTVSATAWRVVKEDDYLGSGPGSAQDRLLRARNDLTFENSALQIVVSLGVPGAVLSGLLLLFAGAVAVRRGRFEAVSGLVACVIVASGYNAWDSNPETLGLLSFPLLLALSPLDRTPAIER